MMRIGNMLNRRLAPAACLLAACMTACAGYGPAQVDRPTPQTSCCLPPSDRTSVDVYFDPIGGAIVGPDSVPQETQIRAIVWNVNPLLYEYRIQANEHERPQAEARDFFAWWLGGFPSLTAPTAARALELHNFGPPLPVCADVASMVPALLESNLALTADIRQAADSMADRRGRLRAPTNVLLDASTRAPEWRSAITVADRIAGTAAAELATFEAEYRVGVRDFVAQVDTLKKRFQDLGAARRDCPGEEKDVAWLTGRAVAHASALADVQKQLTALQEVAARYRRLAADPNAQYRLATLPKSRRPSDLTIIVSRRSLEPDAKFTEVATKSIRVGGEPRLHIGGGVLLAPIQSATFGISKRATFDPATGEIQPESRVIVAKSEDTWRVVPMLALTTNASSWGWRSNAFATFAVGLDTGTGKAKPGYFGGIGYWLTRELGVQLGAYAGQRSRLGRGQALGDVIGDNTPTVDESLGMTAGFGIVYRIR